LCKLAGGAYLCILTYSNYCTRILQKQLGKFFYLYRQNFRQQGKFYEKAINIYKPPSQKIKWELCDPDADQLTHCSRCKRLELVMLKTKGQTFRYRFWNETKTLRYRFRICPVENRLFRFGPESALLDQIEMISLDTTNSETNSNVLVLFLLDNGTFVERLWNVCGTFVPLLF
jgi:hypothetical protein